MPPAAVQAAVEVQALLPALPLAGGAAGEV